MTRVYVPTTLARLRQHLAANDLGPVPDAVVPQGSDEEDEYAALMTAADASADILGDGPGRRVVVVAEVADPGAALAWSDVVAVHADADARPDGADPDDDLAWYAVQEVADLVDE